MHCQDVSSFANAPVKICCLWAAGLVCVCMCVLSFYFCPKCIVKMCHLSPMHLSRSVVFGQWALCVCACVFFLFISALIALSRCVVFWQCTCQDVSSFGNAPVKMCRLWAGSLVCVFFLFISALIALSRCVVYRQYTCQDVSSLGGGALCACVCVLPFYLCSKCIVQVVSSFGNAPVKRCRLWAGALCVCVCLLHYLCPKCIVKMCRLSIMHLSRCVVFRQCTCQDVSSLGRGPCVCVCACVCSFSLFLP